MNSIRPPLKPFSWGNIKEKLASLGNTMVTGAQTPLSDSTRVRPGEGAQWVDSPHSRDGSQRVEAGGTASRAEVSDYGSKTVAQVALFVAGMCLMGMLFAIYVARDAKTEAQVATMRVEGMTRALIAHGIKDTYPHVPGEDD